MVKSATNMVGSWKKVSNSQPLDMRDWLIRYSIEVAARGAANVDLNIMDPAAVKPKLASLVPMCLREASLRSIMVCKSPLHVTHESRLILLPILYAIRHSLMDVHLSESYVRRL
jgi:hypothetical protein